MAKTTKSAKSTTLKLIKDDPWLKDYEPAIAGRHQHALHPDIYISDFIKQTKDGCSGSGRLMQHKYI